MPVTPEAALARARAKDPTAETFVVRLYDGFDGEWMDVTGPLTPIQAKAEWSSRTKDGTEKTSYDDIDYYAIYPSTVKMVWSEGGLGAQNRAAPDSLRDFARWLVSMDDPEDVVGREERRTVTLSKIIERAREALGE